jgi:hypothetical protein
MGKLTLKTLAPAALLVAGFLLSGRANAQCADTNPEMVCPLATCITLQAAVVLNCKTPPPLACRRISGCAALQAMRARWESCRDSRNTINATCFGGGNPGHQQAAALADLNVRNCDARIALPEPEGCADPCP